MGIPEQLLYFELSWDLITMEEESTCLRNASSLLIIGNLLVRETAQNGGSLQNDIENHEAVY